jgi:hypothetical protein
MHFIYPDDLANKNGLRANTRMGRHCNANNDKNKD